MIPDKAQWHTWSALEKVTYVAQLLVPVSLFATVLFSYLGWREARAAQELTKAAQKQERAFFIAQNPPQLELTAGRMIDSDAGPILFLYIKNIGDSAARPPCTEVRRIQFDPHKESTLASSCAATDPYANATLRKDEGLTFHIPPARLSAVRAHSSRNSAARGA